MASKNKVKYGLSNVYVAPFTINDNQYIYDTPVAVPGAVNLTLSASGDTNDFYADNVIYFSSTANQGYEGDLELAMITDYIRTNILGETTDNNGALIENANALPNGFAFGFLSYCFIKVFSGRIKEISPTMWGITLFLAISFFLR